MALLRPVSFFVPSSTELRVVFSSKLVENISKENFEIESLSGNINNLEILGAQVVDETIILKTRPQVANSFYLLKMLSSNENPFISTLGEVLVNDEGSREIFFIGSEEANPIRDNVYRNIPGVYNLDNTLIKKTVDVQSEELFRAQKHIGEVLSDNYISVITEGELRTRGSGAYDRLANEGAYELDRVASSLPGELLSYDTINLNDSSIIVAQNKMPNHPVALNQVIKIDEEISLDSEGNGVDKFLISLSNNEILQLISLKIIKNDEIEDCNGNIGTLYDIRKHKYAILSDKYDPNNSFSAHFLDSNQILLSEFGNISEPKKEDVILVSYIYKDKGKLISKDSIEAFSEEYVESESVPTHSTRFFLDHAPIVNASGLIPELSGVSFSSNENSLNEFSKELKFNNSRLPSNPGEYSINHNTGEVYVYGLDSDKLGTGRKNIRAKYSYKNIFEKNIDYYIDGDDIYPSSTRELHERKIKIEFKYEEVFVEGVDFKNLLHIEAINEHAENNYTSSFSIKTKNTPITKVYRIFNQTTGEIYPAAYFTDSEIYFSGVSAPKILESNSESANFSRVGPESLSAYSSFICPAFSAKITSRLSNNAIYFSPSIPSELVDTNSLDYFIESETLEQDTLIKFFGDPNAEGVINSIGISSSAVMPIRGASIRIGTKGFSINLENSNILSKSMDSIGSYINSSLSLSDSDTFLREKFFYKNNDLTSNVSNLRRVGDYIVDYNLGIVYVAVGRKKSIDELGFASYACGKIDAKYKNILDIKEVSKKSRPSDSADRVGTIYKDVKFDKDFIQIFDLESSLNFSGEDAFDENNMGVETFKVLSNYTVAMPNKIIAMEGLYSPSDIFGENLDSEIKANRHKELSSDQLSLSASRGGGNFYDSSYMEIKDNIIDLKKNIVRRFSKNKDNNLEILILEKDIKLIYSVIRDKNKEDLFDSNRAVQKIKINVVSSTPSEDGILLGVSSGTDISSINSDTDVVVDNSGNVFSIVGSNEGMSTILVKEGDYTFAPGECMVAVIADITLSSSGVKITIPGETSINPGDVISISLVKSLIPSVDSNVASNYRYGKIFATYTYVQDDLYVSYEYGDNQLDWSEGNKLVEGQDYYVSYKYGGSREALRDNFGRLTDISFFSNLSLNVDREIYRSALKGTISAFTSGPTIPAFKGLGEAFTGVDPDVNESFFGNWILGRDMLDHKSYNYNGNLKFLRGKFGTGLNFNDDVTLDIPCNSNLSIEEGTASAWVRPFWGGICNDASLSVAIDNLDDEKHVYNKKISIFDSKNGYSIFNSEDAIGGTDDSGDLISIFNYRNIDKEESIGAFGVTRDYGQLNRFNKSIFSIEFKVDNFSAPGNNISNKFCSPGLISIGDKNKVLALLFSLNPVADLLGNVIQVPIVKNDIERLEIPDFDKNNPSKNCYCSLTDTIDSLSTFNNQRMRIGFNAPLDLTSVIGTSALFDNSPSIFRLLDSSGSIYNVVGLLDCAGREIYDKVISNPCGFIVDRFPENKGHVTSISSSKLNDYLPSGSLTILTQNISIIDNGNKSSSILGHDGRSYIVDFTSGFLKIELTRDPANNIAKIFIRSSLNNKKKEIKLFYSSLLNANNFNNLYDAMNMDDADRILSNTENVDSISLISSGLFIGSLDQECKSLIQVKNIKSNVESRFSTSDVYIGRSGRNPKESTFDVHKDDFPNVSVGIPHNYNSDEGIFVGFDELCKSPVSDDSGQWILKAKANNLKKMPVGVSAVTEVKALSTSLIPEYLLPFKTAGFEVYIDVFGIPVFATKSVLKEDHLYAANILAQIIDNNADGRPDDRLVLDNIVGRGGYIIVSKDSNDLSSYNSFIWKDKGYMYGRSIFSNNLSKNTFEQLFQFIIEAGLSYSYPENFDLEVGSNIASSMNDARDGYFVVPPEEYSDDAWFFNTDRSCAYSCQIKRYFFLGMLSKLNINVEEYYEEWSIENSQELEDLDPILFNILSEEYIPSIAPNGLYSPASSDISYKNIYANVESMHTFTGRIITDGEFSSVEKMLILDDESCEDNSRCNSEYRYCGRGLLEDSGWRNIVKSEIEAANVISGGSENESLRWNKVGEFKTSESGGVYRMESYRSIDNMGNFISSPITCSGSEFNHIVSTRVSSIDYSPSPGSVLEFDGMVSGKFSGITPIHFKNKDINIKITLGVSSNNSDLLLIVDAESNKILDIIKGNWRDGEFHEYFISKSEYSDVIKIGVDDEIISRIDKSELSAPSLVGPQSFAKIHVLDSEYIDSNSFHKLNDSTSLDIDFIKYVGSENSNIIENSNIGLVIDTDKRIEFLLKMPPPLFIDGYSDGYLDGYDGYLDGYDGYLDGYDGYLDGYFEEVVSKNGIAEIRFSSDKLRFLMSTGHQHKSGKLSIFKDGKGFLNFRIYSLPKNNPPQIFNVATSIKHFRPGELHHISASWRLNTPYEMDEMHLFVDGLEAPNLFKFGGAIPVSVNNKFSDVSREILHNFSTGGIDFPEEISGGTVVAGQSLFMSDNLSFDESFIGRSIIVSDSKLAPTLIGEELIISGVSGGSAIIASGDKLTPFIFNTSTTDIAFSFPPTAGLSRLILTDFKSSKFAIYREKQDGNPEELGGVLYSVADGIVKVIEKRTGRNPSYRINVDTRVVEFIKKDLDTCNHISSIDYSDSNIYIETFGLIYSRIKNQINLGGSSYRAPKISQINNLISGSENIFSGNSILFVNASEPTDLLDVNIRKVVKDRFIPAYNKLEVIDSKVLVDFEEVIDQSDNSGLMSSDSIQIHKANLGRLIDLEIDSDNILFGQDNEIIVHGETFDGLNYEKFSVRGNGVISSNKVFKNISRITGSLFIADEDYEICTIKILETNPITISDNNGESAEILSYESGAFIFGTSGSSGSVPFELTPGRYIVDYPAHLSVELKSVGERLHIGTDGDKNNSFGGIIDEFKVISEMLSDTRPTDSFSGNHMSVTSEFNKTHPSCPDEQTLALIDFDNPIREQSRKLRSQVFLNSKTNNKFKLTLEQREVLLEKINNQEEFIYALSNMGIDKDLGRKVFIEAHRAAGGPIKNRAIHSSYGKKVNYSRNSVNSKFESSARFFGGSPYIIDNSKSIFRKDEGTIEFWISPLLGSNRDYEDRYYVDIFSVSKVRIKSSSPTKIILPSTANKIIGVHLINRKSEMDDFYKKEEIDSILFDEINRSEITGKLEGGSSVGKDFSVGHILSPDGRSIKLLDALPGSNTDIIVSYIPIESMGNRISIYKDSKNNLVFSIKSDEKIHSIRSSIKWEKNTWHRVCCTYKANSSEDLMRLFIDGKESGSVTYGEKDIAFGDGSVFGQRRGDKSAAKNISYKISLSDEFRAIAIGSDNIGMQPAMARIDNIRFSREARRFKSDASGVFFDSNYSSNLNSALPVISDDLTTILINFNKEIKKDINLASITDAKNGIFEFDLNIIDSFGKIQSEEVEDLIVELAERLKPAHSNCLVTFPDGRC